jgi:hypothetical protein
MINAPSSIKNADQARVPDMHPDQEGQSVVLRTKSMVRSTVEHAFQIIKRLFGLFAFACAWSARAVTARCIRRR